ncbi:5'-3' exonuclease [Methylobacterium hispanicum]|nr:5'-3' exonuclease H3TH domain-containing protein [Methylobacterium hispanicum]
MHRAYHLALSAAPARNTRPSDGFANGAIRKFCERLLGFLETGFGETRPSHLGIFFDHSRRSHRSDLFPGYKANRPEPPADLELLKPLFRDAVRAFGYGCIEAENYEADDLIATYATAASARGAHVLMVGSDKDLLQLVGPTIYAFDFEYGVPGRSGYRPARLFDAAAVAAAWEGTSPERLGDVLALMGDATDNVPGVPGIGLKTAAKLIAEHGDLETLLANAGAVRQPGRRDALLANADMARLSRRLVELERNAPMPVPLDDLLLGWPDPDVLFPFVNAMEFSWLGRRLGQLYQVDASEYPSDPRFAAAPAAAVPAPEDLAALRYAAVLPGDDAGAFAVDGPGWAVSAMPSSMAHVDAWIRFDFRRPDLRVEQGPGHEGWKIHVSVDPGQVAEAWDALLPIAAEARLQAKVAGPSLLARLGDPANRQAGKTLVLYAETAPDVGRWRAILARVEEALDKAGVAPGPRVAGDRPISGSSYLQRRADRGRDGRYASGPAAYNPFGWPDPFEVVSVAGRPRSDARADALRCMDFVVPGWRLDADGMSWAAPDEEDAALTAKAMSVAGIDAIHEANAVWFEELHPAVVAAGWHDVMEVRRAAEIGAVVRSSFPEGAVRFSVRPRISGEQPPEIRLRFTDEALLRAAAEGLAELFRAPGGPVSRTEDGMLAIPYAGWIHRGPTLDAAQALRLRQLIDPEGALPRVDLAARSPAPR